MKIKHCKKYDKYVSQQHCEFFNEGKDCPYYSSRQWHSIKDLLRDAKRPKREVTNVIKPFKCSLMDQRRMPVTRAGRPARGRQAGARG